MSPKTSTKDGGKGRVLTYGATSRHQQPAAELSSESRGRNALYGNRHSTSLSSTMSLPSSSNPKSIRDELKSPEDATKKRKHHSAFKSTAAPVARATSSSALSSQHSSLHLVSGISFKTCETCLNAFIAKCERTAQERCWRRSPGPLIVKGSKAPPDRYIGGTKERRIGFRLGLVL